MSLLQFSPTEHPCLQNHTAICLKKKAEGSMYPGEDGCVALSENPSASTPHK